MNIVRNKEASFFKIKVSDELSKNIESAYEWEYKYHKIKESLQTNPVRKEKALEELEAKLYPVLDAAIEPLTYVYANWLDQHAILDPHKWAKNRLETYEESIQLTYDLMASEYNRYVQKGNIFNDFMEVNYEYFIPIVEEYIQSDIENFEYELKTEENENERKEIQERIDDLKANKEIYKEKENISDFMFNFASNIKDIVTNVNVDENTAEDTILNFYEKKVFPAWYSYWAQEGIDKTRANIEDVYSSLQSAHTLDHKFVMINRALNQLHVTGSMLDYIGEIDPEVSKQFLTYLSVIDTSEWDKDLKELGFW